MLTRRGFVVGGAGAVVAVSLPWRARAQAVAAAPPPVDDLKTLVAVGLDAAKAAGASWADVRFERLRTQMLRSEDDHIVHSGDSESWGVGIRAIVDGVWGFAATWHTDRDAIAACARDAVAIAKANKRVQGRRVTLAPVAKAVGSWTSPFEIDPFDTPLGDRVESLLSGARAALALKGTGKLKVQGSLSWVSQEKTIGNSEGAYFEQRFLRGQPLLNITAIDVKSGQFESSGTDSIIPAQQVGFEVLRGARFADAAVHATELAKKRLDATPVEPDKYDLVIAPTNLWLTIHESIGHSDRARSHARLRGQLRGHVVRDDRQDRQARVRLADSSTFFADRTHAEQPRDLRLGRRRRKTARKWDLIEKGIFVGVPDDARSGGVDRREARRAAASYAESGRSVPFQRMPNVSLAAVREARRSRT